MNLLPSTGCVGSEFAVLTRSIFRLSGPENQCHGGDRDTLFPPFETEMLCGRSFDRYPVIVYTHCIGHCNSHRIDVRSQLGTLHPDGAIHISYFISLFAQQRRDATQQDFRVDTPVIRRCVGKMLSDVAQGRGPQQRVA